MKNFFLKRIREPSTWAGIVALAAGLGGFQFDEEQRQAIIQLGLALAGVLFVFTREQTKTGEQIADAVESITEAPAKGDYGLLNDLQSSAPVTTSKQAPTKPVSKPLPTRGLVGRINRNT